VFYLIIIWFIPFLYKNIFFNSINCLLFFSPKIFKLGKFSYFFTFLFLPFLFFSFFSSPSCYFLLHTRTEHSKQTAQQHGRSSHGPSPAPLLQPSLSPSRTPSSPPAPLLSPLSPLSRACHTTINGTSTPAMASLPWRVSHKLIFLRGMTKMDAHDLPLAITTLIFIRNEL
jgi:hypothetical protein